MNCSFNIRYKPRTTRAYTKTDLTVYDSADNTALNALTVYGKSEVVDGSIKSAGESGSIEVQTYTGTNQFGGLPFATALNNASYTSTIDTVNKTVTFNNANISDPANYIILYTGGFKENIQYSFIFTGNITTSAGHNTSLAIYYTDGTREQITINSLTKQTVKTVSSINKTIKNFGLAYYGDALSILYYDECGIFEGDIDVSAFEPYNGTMATFTTGTPLRGIPDEARDTATWNGVSGEVVKNCGKCKGSDLTWTQIGDTDKFYTVSLASILPPIKIGGRNAICTDYELTHQGYTNMPDKTFSICMHNFSQASAIIIRDSSYSDVTTFALAVADVEFVYPLATPTTEQLTTAENNSIAGLRTFEPQTHAQNNAQTEMTVNYTIRIPTI